MYSYLISSFTISHQHHEKTGDLLWNLCVKVSLKLRKRSVVPT